MKSSHPVRFALACVCLVVPAVHAQFLPPTPAELAMTSIPQVPNAPAVYLFKEETTDDSLRLFSYYVRLKVLTEGGKDYANVELPFYSGTGMNIDNIVGRTIQSDGTVVPFTGKPYEKLIEKGQGFSYKAKVFTLPAVQVGSILEYRYKMRYDDAYFQSPQWYIQSPLYMIKGHYNWRPTSATVVTSDDRGETLNRIAWTPILPDNAKVVQSELIGKAGYNSGGNAGGNSQIDLVVQDIPPLPTESFMPPVNSVSYRVLFYYTSYKTAAEYWTREGKRWVHDRDKFIGPGSAVNNKVKELIAPGDTQEAKLKKIYAAVMTLENTDFTRSRSTQEEKAQGLKSASTSDDILTRQRGSSDQLAELFVAMVRAAGMKAYVMGVANRSERIFLTSYLSMRQLDDLIAIVPVDGKDVFFDPGERYCAYGHLAWKHTLSTGLRESDAGPQIANTPGEVFNTSHTSRIGDLSLDEHGEVSGTVTITYTGAPALRWRQAALRGDDTSLNGDLKRNLEHELPGGMDVRVTDVDGLASFEKPLIIKYEIKGPAGSATGKRLLLPASLFEVNSKSDFTAEKREEAVDLHYPEVVQDAVRIKYPTSFTVESVPPDNVEKMGNTAAFSISAKRTPTSVTLFRNVTIGKTFFAPSEYPDLRNFYGKLDGKQTESLVLTRTDSSAAKSTSGGSN